MSNEEVVLQMIVNRLVQLLELREDLREKWGAEITEIIHLGKGVIIETPEPPVGRPDRDWTASTYTMDALGDWHLPITDEMFSYLYESNFDNWPRNLRREFLDRLDQMHTNMNPEPNDDDPDDDPDYNDPPMPQVTFQGNTFEIHLPQQGFQEQITPERLAQIRQQLQNLPQRQQLQNLPDALEPAPGNPGDAAHAHPTVGGEEQ